MEFRKVIVCIVCLFFSQLLSAQDVLYGAGIRWDDSFKEWIIYTEDEEVEGELAVRWASKDDWSDWDYRIGEESGSIQQKWASDPSLWELRGGNEIITMQRKWKGDMTEWRIKSGNETLTLESKYKNNLEEWSVKEEKNGKFEIYTTYEQDVRDWDIIDELDAKVSIHTKMAMLFIVLYHSTPKV